MAALEKGDGKCDKCQSNPRKKEEKEVRAVCVTNGREVGREGAWLTLFGSCEPSVMLNCPVSSHCIISLLTA